MSVPRGSSDYSTERVLNTLQPLELRKSKRGKEGITVVNSATDESICKEYCCVKVKEMTNPISISYMEPSRLNDLGNVICEGQVGVEHHS